MSPQEFVKQMKGYAVASQEATGVPYQAILAQAAWESGWGKFAPGNMFFGVKDTDGLNGNEQLLVTTEIHKTPDVKYPKVISVKPVIMNGQKMFRYKVMDYFRKYKDPSECFIDHGKFLRKYKRYAKAFQHTDNAEKFLEAVADAGYATDPNYKTNLKKILRMIQKYDK